MNGNFIIHLSLIFYIISFFFVIIHLYYKKCVNKSLYFSIGVYCFILGCTCAILSFIILIYSYVISDMSLVNVALHSSIYMPKLYKIAATWSNHEGSMLLLLTYCAIASVVFFIINNRSEVVIYALVGQLLFIITLLIFIIKTSNPFLKSLPIPVNGFGLNPILQDFGLILHPPILYCGYASCFIIYTISIAFCKSKKTQLHYIQPWIYLALSFLTLGIGMGSWWAYKEIGWGGYWFWDAVENISLLPWLTICGLIHIIRIPKRENMLLFLCILSFLVILFQLFLVRAGILQSIHSFAEDIERGHILLGIFLAYSSYSLYALSNNIKNIKITCNQFEYIILGFISILISCIILIIASILYPYVYEMLFSTTIIIDKNFFNITFNSLMILALMLCTYATLIFNVKTVFNIKNHMIFILISCIITCFFIDKISIDYLNILALIGIGYSVYTITCSFFAMIRYRNLVLMHTCHIGFCIGIIVIATAALFSYDCQKVINVGDTIVFDTFQISLLDIQHRYHNNYISKFAILQLSTNDLDFILKPEIRIFPIEKQMIIKSAILRRVFYDVHININEVIGHGFMLNFYYKPLMSWLWLSIIMISSALIIKAYNLFIQSNKIKN